MLRLFLILFILIYASIKDIKTLEIPDFCFLLILVLSPSFGLQNIIRFLFVAFVYFLTVLIASLFKKPVPFGMADAKLFAALAFSLESKAALYIFCAASILSGLFAVILILKKRCGRDCFAFGPFILAGYLCYLLQCLK